MTLDLTAEESAALLAELDRVIDGDRYFLLPRIRTLTAIRDKPPCCMDQPAGRSDPESSWSHTMRT